MNERIEERPGYKRATIFTDPGQMSAPVAVVKDAAWIRGHAYWRPSRVLVASLNADMDDARKHLAAHQRGVELAAEWDAKCPPDSEVTE